MVKQTVQNVWRNDDVIKKYVTSWWRHWIKKNLIKFWKPQVTDWNLVNSEHHLGVTQKNEANRVEPRQPFHGTFSRLWRHMRFNHRPLVISRPLDMVLIQDMEMKKFSGLFVYFYSDWVCWFLMWTRYMAVKRSTIKRTTASCTQKFCVNYVMMTSLQIKLCRHHNFFGKHPSYDFYFKMNLNLI